MPEPNKIRVGDRAALEQALASNPRLLQFLRDLEQSIAEFVPKYAAEYPNPREATVANFYNAEHNVQLLSNQAALNPQIACKAGCWWCCTKPAQVTAPEVLIIVMYMQETWDEARIEALKARTAKYMATMRGKPQSKWVYQRARCPLLGDDNLCSVYEVRPLVCRSWTSVDASLCESGYKSRWSTGEFMMVFEYMAMVQMVSEFLQVYLRPSVGELEDYVLGHALHIALTTPNADERWLAGEDIFEAAKWTQ